MKTLTLVVLMLLSTQAFAGGLSLTQNEWYLYGNQVLPEEPQLEEVNGKLVVTVNGVQVVPPLAGPVKKVAANSECLSMHELINEAASYAESLIAEGLSPQNALELLIEFYRSSDLVESAESVNNAAVAVRWKSGGNYLAVVPGGESQLWQRREEPDPSIQDDQVQQQYEMLHMAWERQYLVIITGTGSNYYYPPRHPEFTLEEVRVEIARARELGSASWNGEILSDRVVEELRQPRALLSIQGR